MKRRGVLVFIWSAIAALALLCAVFPDGGIRLGAVSLDMPGIGEVLAGAGDAVSAPDPAELLEQRHRSVANAAGSRLADFMRNDQARFYLPGDDPAFFDGLFGALEMADSLPVRVIHYGDSQIEEDRITGTIREFMQKRFGGSGPGLMPARKHYTARFSSASSVELQKFKVYGDTSMRAGISSYGPYAEFDRLDTTVTLTFSPTRNKSSNDMFFNRVTLLAGNITGGMRAVSRGVTVELSPSAPVATAVFDYPDSSTRATLNVSGAGDLYGVLLDTDRGVMVDNVPMRGSSGTVFTAMNSAQLRAFYSGQNVRMILLQYGGNSVPYLKTDKAVSNFAGSIRRQISHLRKLAPDACIVFIGPSDMSTLVKGKRQTYPILPSVVDSLRQAANDCGAAYWDIFGAMGGENSMVRWVESSPPLAGPDYVHFTTAGSAEVGRMFSESFMLYYDYYLWRKENE